MICVPGVSLASPSALDSRHRDGRRLPSSLGCSHARVVVPAQDERGSVRGGQREARTPPRCLEPGRPATRGPVTTRTGISGAGAYQVGRRRRGTVPYEPRNWLGKFRAEGAVRAIMSACGRAPRGSVA
jgi:hypothetical protein